MFFLKPVENPAVAKVTAHNEMTVYHVALIFMNHCGRYCTKQFGRKQKKDIKVQLVFETCL
jgi:hypothetical protein